MTEQRELAEYAQVAPPNGTAQQRSLGYALHVALKALSFESAQWMALLLSFSLFVAAVWWPERNRIAAACLFTALVYLPLWLRRTK